MFVINVTIYWYNKLEKMIKDTGSKRGDYSFLPKIRQILLPWGYELTEKGFLLTQQFNV